MPNEADKELDGLLDRLKVGISLSSQAPYPVFDDSVVGHAFADFKAELLAWRDRAVRAAEQNTVPLLAQKCYNCGNQTVQIDDRARCPYCGCHESLAEPKEEV